MYRQVGEKVYQDNIEMGNVDTLESLMDNIKRGRTSSNILRFNKEQGVILYKNDNGKVVLIKLADLFVWYREMIKNKVKECKIEDGDILKTILKASSVEVFLSTFDLVELDLDKFYYLNVCHENWLNCSTIVSLYSKYDKMKINVLVEILVMYKRGLFEYGEVKEYIDNIVEIDPIDFVKNLFKKRKVKFKVDSININIEDRVESNMDKNYVLPIIESIHSLPKLKSSKNIDKLDPSFPSDIRLKYLKIRKLLSKSRSVKLTSVNYNNMIEILGREMGQNLDTYKIFKLKQDRYTKQYGEGLVVMLDLIDNIFKCYLENRRVPVEFTKYVVRIRELVM